MILLSFLQTKTKKKKKAPQVADYIIYIFYSLPPPHFKYKRNKHFPSTDFFFFHLYLNYQQHFFLVSEFLIIIVLREDVCYGKTYRKPR